MKGWNSKILPENVLNKVPAHQRPKGNAGLTASEAQSKFEARNERELQALISSDLLRRGIYFVRSRMDRKTTTAKGTPDFICCLQIPLSIIGAFVAIECKHASGSLSDEQQSERIRILRSHGEHYVVRSFADYSAILKHYQIL